MIVMEDIDGKIKTEIKEEVNNDAKPKPVINDDKPEPVSNDVNTNPLSTVHILDSLPEGALSNFKFFNERYYEFKYCVKFPRTGNFDTAVRVHTNRLVLVSLADGHEIIRGNKKIVEVSYEINKNLNRTNNKFSGKGKKGAQRLEPSSILCFLKCDDEMRYPVYCGVYGKFVEVNEKLSQTPNVLVTQRRGLGYVCIIIPDLKRWDEIESNLLTEQQYLEYLNTV